MRIKEFDDALKEEIIYKLNEDLFDLLIMLVYLNGIYLWWVLW